MDGFTHTSVADEIPSVDGESTSVAQPEVIVETTTTISTMEADIHDLVAFAKYQILISFTICLIVGMIAGMKIARCFWRKM